MAIFLYKSLDLETIPSPPLHQGRFLRGTESESKLLKVEPHLLLLLLVMCIGSGSFMSTPALSGTRCFTS